MNERFSFAWLLPQAALAVILGVWAGKALPTGLPALVCLALALVSCLLLTGRYRRAALLLALCALGMLRAQAAYHPAAPEENTYAVQGIVCDEVSLREDGQVKTTLGHVTLNGESLGGSLYWSFYLPRGQLELPQGLQSGCTVQLTARLYHLFGEDNPGGYDFMEAQLPGSVVAGIYGAEGLTCTEGAFCLRGFAARCRTRGLARLQEILGDEAGGFAAALLLGTRSGCPKELSTAFTRLGMAHMLSVSGFHLSVFYAALMSLLAALYVPRRARAVPVLLILWLYALLTGMKPPVLRACITLTLAMIARLLGRRSDLTHLLGASLILVLLVQPAQLTTAGFQLSYSAMAGIGLVSPRFQQLWQPRSRRVRAVWDTLCVTLGAQLATLLPVMYWFHGLPWLGWLVSLPLSALCSLLIPFLWVVFLLSRLPVLGGLLCAAGAGLCDWLLAACLPAANMPQLLLWTGQATALTALGCLLALAALCVLWRRHNALRLACLTLGTLLAVLSLLPMPWRNHGTRYIQLSAGNADAAVLEDQGFVAVIDTGKDATLASYLHRKRLQVDALILTHLHSDHALGIRELMNQNIPVAVLYLPYGAEDASGISAECALLLDEIQSKGTRLCYLGRGDTLALPSGQLEILFPEAGRVRKGHAANEAAMALALRLHSTTLLLMSDLPCTYEHYAAIPADVLKAAHHGSASSSCESFLETVSPSLVLVSCDKPDGEEALRARMKSGMLMSTASFGAITLSIDETGFSAQGYLAPPGEATPSP